MSLSVSTPLLELNNYQNEKGLPARVFAKVEGLNPAGSIKDRAALYMITEAEKSGKLKKDSVIIEADERQYRYRSGGNCGFKGVSDDYCYAGYDECGEKKFDESLWCLGCAF